MHPQRKRRILTITNILILQQKRRDTMRGFELMISSLPIWWWSTMHYSISVCGETWTPCQIAIPIWQMVKKIWRSSIKSNQLSWVWLKRLRKAWSQATFVQHWWPSSKMASLKMPISRTTRRKRWQLPWSILFVSTCLRPIASLSSKMREPKRSMIGCSKPSTTIHKIWLSFSLRNKTVALRCKWPLMVCSKVWLRVWLILACRLSRLRISIIKIVSSTNLS